MLEIDYVREINRFLDELAVYKDLAPWQIKAEREMTKKLQALFDGTFAKARAVVMGRKLNESQMRIVSAEFAKLKNDLGSIFGDSAVQSANMGRSKALSQIGFPITEFSKTYSDLIAKHAFEASQHTLERMTGDVMDNLRGSYEKGLGIDETARELSSKFDSMRGYELKRIARTEINSHQNEGAHLTVQDLGIQYEQWWTAEDERVRGNEPTDEADHTELHGQIARTGDSFSNGLAYPGDRSGPIEEWINCFIDYQVPIYTLEGYKRIGDIQVGDMVLTHKGRFKRVVKVSDRRQYDGEVIRIKTKFGKKITVTPNHRILTDRGWIQAQNIIEKDKLVFISNKKCGVCGNPIPLKTDSPTCSQSCKTTKQWQNEEMRRRMCRGVSQANIEQYQNEKRDRYKQTEKANKKMRELIKEGSWHLSDISKKQTGENHWMKVNPKRWNKLKPKYRELMQKLHAELKAGKVTEIEKRIGKLLRNLNIVFEFQYPILEYVADFYLPDFNIVIECDGIYWHNSKIAKKKDRIRDARMKGLGINVLRLSEIEINKDIKGCEEKIKRLVSNHKGEYRQGFLEIISIERRQLKKKVRLYNFSVEDDESYIAHDIAVHNCRCRVVPFIMPENMAAPEGKSYFYEGDLIVVKQPEGDKVKTLDEMFKEYGVEKKVVEDVLGKRQAERTVRDLDTFFSKNADKIAGLKKSYPDWTTNVKDFNLLKSDRKYYKLLKELDSTLYGNSTAISKDIDHWIMSATSEPGLRIQKSLEMLKISKGQSRAILKKTFPRYAEIFDDVIVDNAYTKDTIKEYMRTQKLLNVFDVKEVKLYRGIIDKSIDSIPNASKTFNYHVRATESWTTDKNLAKDFGNIILEKTFKTKDLFTGQLGRTEFYESEFLPLFQKSTLSGNLVERGKDFVQYALKKGEKALNIYSDFGYEDFLSRLTKLEKKLKRKPTKEEIKAIREEIFNESQ